MVILFRRLLIHNNLISIFCLQKIRKINLNKIIKTIFVFIIITTIIMARTKYYHVDEVAELLELTTDEVRSMLKRKELKGHKLGRRWLIDMDQPCFENLADANKSQKTDEKEVFIKYIKDAEHEEIFGRYLASVKKSLYIATCDFMNLTIEGEKLVDILNGMARRGIKVVVKCMNPHGNDQSNHDFELIKCDRCHMKLFVFDEKVLYMGSANITKAALGRNDLSRRAYNYEAGLLTNDVAFIKQAMSHFNMAAQRKECKDCKKKGCERYNSL